MIKIPNLGLPILAIVILILPDVVRGIGIHHFLPRILRQDNLQSDIPQTYEIDVLRLRLFYLDADHPLVFLFNRVNWVLLTALAVEVALPEFHHRLGAC